MTRKKIGLYLGVTTSAGGMFQYAQCILDAMIYLQSDSLEIIVVYGDPAWEPILNKKSISGVHLKNWLYGEKFAKLFLPLPIELGRKLANLFNPLVAEISNFGCDLWVFPAQDVLAWQINAPIVSSIHDLMHRYERKFPEASMWWRFMLREYRFKKLVAVSSAILVDSEIGRKQVIESYGAQSVCTFSLPYIAPSYLNAGNTCMGFDNIYRLPKKFFFYPAQFWPHKNHLRLLDALAEARKLCPDMELVLSGGYKHNYQSIKLHACTLGIEDSVHFVGYVPDSDIAGFYRRARGLVMPTFFGPTNIPPLEAMATECPILISGIYGMPEQCGDAALYFSPYSTKEISTLMMRLWTDTNLYDRLLEAGKIKNAAWGQTQFNKSFAEVLQRLIATPFSS